MINFNIDPAIITEKIHLESVIEYLKDKRELKVGTELMKRMHNKLINDEVRIVEISAQISAINFYKKLGYIEEGDKYIEAGIEHIKMKKKLS